MKYLVILLVFGLISACQEEAEVIEVDEQSPAFLKERIQEMDDSLNVLMEKALTEKDYAIGRLVYHEAANRNISFYNSYPENDFAPEALEKAASMYMAINLEERAAEWRDTLIQNYPNYKHILAVLELQKSFYDNFEAYNPEMIKKYCQMILEKGDDQLTPEKREAIEFRLEHIDLNFKELIQLQNPDLEL